MGAGVGWCTEENLIACKAFISATENPRKGNSQKLSAFQESIHQEFRRMEIEKKANGWKYTTKDRNGAAIYQRYGRIKAQCHKFEECYQRVLAAQPTGAPSEDDLIRAATAIHSGQLVVDGKSNRALYRYFGDDAASPGKQFPFLNCYLWMRNTNMWKHTLEAISATRNLFYADDGDEEEASPMDSTGTGRDGFIRGMSGAPYDGGNSEESSPSVPVGNRSEGLPGPAHSPVCVDVNIVGKTVAASQLLDRTGSRRRRSDNNADKSSGKRRKNNPPSGGAQDKATNQNAVRCPSRKGSANNKRATGAKQAIENHKQLQVLEPGAHGIEALVSESKKRNELFNGLLEVQQRQSRMALLTMKGSDPSLLQRFLDLEQGKILEEVEKESVTRVRTTTKVTGDTEMGLVNSNQQQPLSNPSVDDGGASNYDSGNALGGSHSSNAHSTTRESIDDGARVMSVSQLLD